MELCTAGGGAEGIVGDTWGPVHTRAMGDRGEEAYVGMGNMDLIGCLTSVQSAEAQEPEGEWWTLESLKHVLGSWFLEGRSA